MSSIKEDRHPRRSGGPQGMPLRDETAKQEMVQEEAHALLLESPYRELWNVACDFREGVLTLRGRVPSYFLKQVAQSIVFVMERVETINNRLEVVSPTKSD